MLQGCWRVAAIVRRRWSTVCLLHDTDNDDLICRDVVSVGRIGLICGRALGVCETGREIGFVILNNMERLACATWHHQIDRLGLLRLQVPSKNR